MRDVIKNRRVLFCLLLALSTLMIESCSQQTVIQGSPAEQAVLRSNPFVATDNMTGVDSRSDSLQPLNFLDAPNIPNLSFVHRCDSSQYQTEKAAALAAVANDKTNSTIAVAFSVSEGSVTDNIAYYAHERAILRDDDTGLSPVSVDGSSGANYNNSLAFHYITDHTQAKQDFLDGSKCYFDTIKVVGSVSKPVWSKKGIYSESGTYNHPVNIMYFGYGNPNCAATADLTTGLCQRLLAKVNQGSPQIIPLYMADIRGGLTDPSIMNTTFTSSTVRNTQVFLPYQQIFHLENIVSKYDTIVAKMSADQTIVSDMNTWKEADSTIGTPLATGSTEVSLVFSGYAGAPQVIDNLIFTGLKGTITATQYTPIVLDLGAPNIRTSSLAHGSFFNLSMGKNPNCSDPSLALNHNHHQTAWVGGALTNVGTSAAPVWRNVADDGFLVLPDANGNVNSAQNLFGSAISIQGKTYDNGFLALQALASKDCTSSDVTKRYFGPWDGDLYASKVKVWVDANRNGIAEASEIMTLQEAGVAAISACNVVSSQASDNFGNATSMRAAILMSEGPNATLPSNTEIISRITTGQQSNGNVANFRVAVDLLFQTNPNFILEDLVSSQADPQEIQAWSCSSTSKT